MKKHLLSIVLLCVAVLTGVIFGRMSAPTVPMFSTSSKPQFMEFWFIDPVSRERRRSRCGELESTRLCWRLATMCLGQQRAAKGVAIGGALVFHESGEQTDILVLGDETVLINNRPYVLKPGSWTTICDDFTK